MEDIMKHNAYLDYYSVANVRETCHAVKQDLDQDLYHAAIQTIASSLTSVGIADNSSYLVPAPQHTGAALYTKKIAELIAETTGAHLLDIVKCNPCKPLYERKIRGEESCQHFFLIEDVPTDGKLIFVDNVISSGSTYRAINELFKTDLIPLVYSVDYPTLGDREPFNLIEQIKREYQT